MVKAYSYQYCTGTQFELLRLYSLHMHNCNRTMDLEIPYMAGSTAATVAVSTTDSSCCGTSLVVNCD